VPGFGFQNFKNWPILCGGGEGLVTHLTGLILIDEAATQEASIPATRRFRCQRRELFFFGGSVLPGSLQHVAVRVAG
jgi:hypothetical protein